jgi:Fe-S-cluster containining protein
MTDDHELRLAFHETHRRIGANTAKLYEAAAYALGVADLLVAKGLAGVEEVEQFKRAAEQRLDEAYRRDGLMIDLADAPADKYAMDTPPVEIDCAARIPVCRAACCRLRFALTEQDIHEGKVEWELTHPYVNRHSDDGWCVHCTDERHCSVYDARPAVCRTYDCRKDARVWVDFEKWELNPDLAADYAALDAGEVRVPEPTVRR